MDRWIVFGKFDYNNRDEFCKVGGLSGWAIDLAHILQSLVVNASPKQLGAVAAALARSRQLEEDGAIATRTKHLGDAVRVHAALQESGYNHHHLGQAIQQARNDGRLPGESGCAARRVQRRANQARHPSSSGTAGHSSSAEQANFLSVCEDTLQEQWGEASVVLPSRLPLFFPDMQDAAVQCDITTPVCQGPSDVGGRIACREAVFPPSSVGAACGNVMDVNVGVDSVAWWVLAKAVRTRTMCVHVWALWACKVWAYKIWM
jgi:hypothetical protein